MVQFKSPPRISMKLVRYLTRDKYESDLDNLHYLDECHEATKELCWVTIVLLLDEQVGVKFSIKYTYMRSNK